MKFQVFENAPGGRAKCAAHAGYDSTAADVGWGGRLRRVCCLFDELAEEFISERSQVMNRLQEILDVRYGIVFVFQLVKNIEELQGFGLQCAVVSPVIG